MFFEKCQTEVKEDPFKLKLRHQGPLNKNKVIYYIHEENENLGFFAMYRYWMEYLYFADVCGFTPIVDACNSFAYCEDGNVREKRNGFELYFCQPSQIRLQEVKFSNKVIYSNVIHREMVELVYTGKCNHYLYTQKYLYVMSKIVKKYMKFNENTRNYINSGCKKLDLFEQKVLGIHIRGTDFRTQYNNHPVCLKEEDYFVEIDRIWKTGNYDKIFLATDDSRILKVFLDKYANRICYYPDIARSSQNKSVAFIKNNRKNHKYLLGLEVIRDMYSLAVCQGLIAGISQVSICAQINKMAMGQKYKDLVVIDKGINKNNRRFRK